MEELNRALTDLNNYLIYILVRGNTETESVRSLSGLIVKNNITNSEGELPLEYIKQECLNFIGMGNAHRTIQNITGILITTIATKYKLNKWPNLIPTLSYLIESNNPVVNEAAFGALHKICEDCSDLTQYVDSQFVCTMLHYLQHSSPKIRYYAIACINQFIVTQPDLILSHMNILLESLFRTAYDQEVQIRSNICQSFGLILEVSSEHLIPYMPTIIDYMIQRTQDPDDGVALIACEFWLSLVEQPMGKTVLAPSLSNLIPILMKCMRYSPVHVALLNGNADDSMVPDRQEDIRPRFHKSKPLYGKFEIQIWIKTYEYPKIFKFTGKRRYIWVKFVEKFIV